LYQIYQNLPTLPTSWTGKDLENIINTTGKTVNMPTRFHEPIARVSRKIVETTYAQAPSDVKNLIDSTTTLMDSGKNSVMGAGRAIYGATQLARDRNSTEGAMNWLKGSGEFVTSPLGAWNILQRGLFHSPQSRIHMTPLQRVADDLWHAQHGFTVDRYWDQLNPEGGALHVGHIASTIRR
jgi:hypothetical protein